MIRALAPAHPSAAQPPGRDRRNPRRTRSAASPSTRRLSVSTGSIGVIQWRTGRYRQARESLARALALHTDTGDPRAMGAGEYNLGIVERRLGRYPEALEHHNAARRILEGLGDIAGQGRATNNAAVVHLQLGDYDEDESCLLRALEIQLRRADRAAESVVLVNLGLVMERTGRLAEAEDTLGMALAIAREVGYPVGTAEALRGLGVASRAGAEDVAGEERQAAVASFVELGIPEAAWPSTLRES